MAKMIAAAWIFRYARRRFRELTVVYGFRAPAVFKMALPPIDSRGFSRFGLSAIVNIISQSKLEFQDVRQLCFIYLHLPFRRACPHSAARLSRFAAAHSALRQRNTRSAPPAASMDAGPLYISLLYLR